MSLHSLPLFLRVRGARVVVVGDGAMAGAKARLVRRAGGEPCAETEAHHARLAFVALEDGAAAAAAALRLRRRGLLVNVADRPDLCDFTLPSILERGPVVVAIGTGGASAGLAKHLRLRLEGWLPQNLGPLAEALGAARDALRRRYPSGEARRAALDMALAQGGALDPLAGAGAAEVRRWLDGADIGAGGSGDTGRTVVFALESDDPDDLTLRQARMLGMADAVYHDPAVAPAILDRARADAVRLPLAGGAALPDAEGLTVVLRCEARGPGQTSAGGRSASTPTSAK